MARIAESVLIGVIVVVIGILLYDTGDTIEGNFQKEEINYNNNNNNNNIDKRVEYFESQGLKIEGWLFTPKNIQNPPVVILAHGFGMQKHFNLENVAESFVKKGIAAFLFDYRHFGGSEGEPRHLIKVSKQVADWHAAIRHVTTLKNINSNKIGLWGTSFAAGHVLTVASEQIARKNPNITCVVTQVPFFDSLSTIQHINAPFSQSLKLLLVALKDLIRSFFGKDIYIPLIGSLDSVAAINVANPDEALNALSLKEGTYGWHNAIPARSLLELTLYRPHLLASTVTVPALVVYMSNDALIPETQVVQTAEAIPNSKLVKIEGSHFDIYKKGNSALEIEAEFFAEHLL